MSAHDVPVNDPVAGADMKLEVVVIPVSDVDRAKEFYNRKKRARYGAPPALLPIDFLILSRRRPREGGGSACESNTPSPVKSDHRF